MELNDLLGKVENLVKDQAALHAKAIEEQKQFGKATSEKLEKLDKLEADTIKYSNAYTDLKTVSDELAKKSKELEAKFVDLERAGLRPGQESKSLGERFVDSEEFKEMQGQKARVSRKYEVGSLLGTSERKDITQATAGSGLIDPQRLSGVTQIPNVPLTIRSLIPVGRTGSSSIQYVKENTFTNNAGPQFSPASPTNITQGAKKNKSDMNWTVQTSVVETIAHYMKASRQILDDVPMLQSEINNRLLYGLALEEEEELLRGTGTNGEILGIIPQAAQYNTALNVSGDTKIDKVAHALLQVMLAKYMPTAVVLSPKDWHDMQLIKTEEGGANRGSYVLGNPASNLEPRLWGYRVLSSLSMTAGDFLVGNFATGAQIFDRMNATVEVARQNEDDFVRNMVSILAEERIALAVYANAAFVEGTF